MNEQKLLGVLQGMEWSGPHYGESRSCPYCGQPRQATTHKLGCLLADALSFVRAKCAKEAAWGLLVGEFGPGRAIVLPTEPRAWGAWNPADRVWMMDRYSSAVRRETSKRFITALLLSSRLTDNWQVREIGPDGLPVPESE